MGYCDTSSPEDGYLKQGYCGATELFGGIFSSGATAASQTVVGVASNANEAVTNVTRNAADVGEKAANPLGLAGLASGLAFGGTLGTVVVGSAVALGVDWLVFEGAGTRSVAGLVTGRRSRR